jgi:hypothetical protein
VQTYSEAIVPKPEKSMTATAAPSTLAPSAPTGVPSPQAHAQPHSPSTSLFDASFGRWLERRLQQWTDAAVVQGESRWSRERGLRSRYY